MKNREYYKDEIKGYAEDDTILAFIRKHGIADTNEVNFSSASALALFIMWLDEEYREPEVSVDWSKVEVDTPILVSTDGKKWFHRHFSEYSGGKVYAFDDGTTSWSKCGDTCWPYAKLAEPQE